MVLQVSYFETGDLYFRCGCWGLINCQITGRLSGWFSSHFFKLVQKRFSCKTQTWQSFQSLLDSIISFSVDIIKASLSSRRAVTLNKSLFIVSSLFSSFVTKNPRLQKNMFRFTNSIFPRYSLQSSNKNLTSLFFQIQQSNKSLFL